MSAFLRGIGLCSLLSLGLLLNQCGPDPVIKTRDGSEMVLIPAGEFPMGGKPEDLADRPSIRDYVNYTAERPVHPVSISAFYIDKQEIDNAQYRRFLEYLERTNDASMDHPDQPADLGHAQQYVAGDLSLDDHPAVGINWFDAYAYCKWAGKRLPTEAEWEYAARGGDGVYRKYPWGNENPDAEGIWRANYMPKDGQSKDGHDLTAPVGSYPDGISPFGVLDMAGNAEEWVQDWLSFGYYEQTAGALDPQGPATGQNKVIKGGSHISDEHHIRIATRLYGAPHVKTPNTGIRCIRDL